MKRNILTLFVVAGLTMLLQGCVGCASASKEKATETKGFITTEGTRLIKDGKPYTFMGCNMWYASILGSEGVGGDRERLCHELDLLKELGITNVRMLSGPDEGSLLANPAKPYLQTAPGVLNDTILEGLDFVIAELEKRDMEAVIYLNNAWDWSGGYGFYLKECGYGDSPNANVEGGYDRYVDYCADFARDTCAQALYYAYVERIVTRHNSITGRPYREEPAIMAWQLCNEPRPFARDSVTKEMFAGWIARAAALIKHLDPNHLVSTGSEGMVGCEADVELCERIHADENIDYLTLHIWPINWGWASRTNPDEGIDRACDKSSQYIALHAEMATRLDKPLVIEEFGYARQGNRAGIGIPTESKDLFYRHIFGEVKRSIAEGGPIAGSNFWGWSGSGRPRQEVWQAGDDYLCDPPHEPQGWYSVFDCDSSTIAVIREYNK